MNKLDIIANSLGARISNISLMSEVAAILFDKVLQIPGGHNVAIERIAYISRGLPSFCEQGKQFDLMDAVQVQVSKVRHGNEDQF